MPAAKTAPPRKTAAAPKKRAARHPAPEDTPRLRTTDAPGVYLNAAGDAVNEHGVLLAFQSLRDAHDATVAEVLGAPAKTPAEVLKWAALDFRLPLGLRLDAAKAAAPYYDRKKPTSIDGGEDPAAPGGPGLPLGNLADLRGLSTKELATLYDLLAKANV